ncbi:hypothetical protein V7S43_017608 [Phytophthora oleae]|uniref:MalT-like TPR region domain-containing protein n=1 Tax=Phytophthora oleae TaxID=2107226 RepID=A0ABD3EWV7_9STRA
MRDKALRDAREEQQELEALHRLDEECIHQQRAGNYLKAFDCMERALVLRRHFFGIESEEVVQACRALAEMCNLLAMSFLQQDNYPVTIDLLKKAEVLTQRHHPVERATTLNNFACYYRRLGKLHSAMTSLKRALELEKRLENVRNAADTQLNMCAVLSQLGKHQQALEHAQEALISLQEGFIHGKETTDTNSENSATSSSRLDRISVMCIAYHNIGVEQEFLKDCAESVVSYKKGVGLAEQYLGADHSITTTIRNSYLAAKRTLAMKARVRPCSATRDPKSPTKAGTRLLSSPQSGSIRTPSPLAKDRSVHIATPRSIIADALSRAPLSALPPLELQIPPSASKKKKNTDAKSALSPTDPFFSPRFRFDSETTGSNVKKLTSISPRAASVDVQAPLPSKGKRRKSSVKKPPTATETSRRAADSKATATAPHSQTGTISDEVQMEVPVAGGNELAEASRPKIADTNDPQHVPIEPASEELESSELPVVVLEDADGAVSMVLTSVIDKVAEQEVGLSLTADGSVYLEEQQNDRVDSSVNDSAPEEEVVVYDDNNDLHVESQNAPTRNNLENDGPIRGEILDPTGEMADVADGEQQQHGAVEFEADFNHVNTETSAEADLNEANTNLTEDSFDGENAQISLDDAQNDLVEYTSGAVVYDMSEEWNPEAAIGDGAVAEHDEDSTIPEETYSSSIQVDCAPSGNEGEVPTESMLEEHPDAREEDQMSAENADQQQVFDQNSDEKRFLTETGERPATDHEAQDVVTEVNPPELHLTTEVYDAEDYRDEAYSSTVVEAQYAYEEVQQEWDAVDQQPSDQNFVDQSEYIATQGYEDVFTPLADESQEYWNQAEQVGPYATEDAAEYSSFYHDSPAEQPPDDTVYADQVQEGDPSDTDRIAVLQPLG